MKATSNVGYLGPRGTFSEEAARAFLAQGGRDAGAQLLPYRTIPDILVDVERGQLAAGIVPIENSIEGSVSVTLDALVHDVMVQIHGEIALPVVHHLMVKPGTELSEVEEALSHPQALAQCRKSLDALLPGVVQAAATSTAEAAQRVAASERPMAAIGTALAAELYGLRIAASNIQDLEENVTRFVAVGLQTPPKSGFDKTSIVFAFGMDRPGNLYRTLRAFARRDINLTKLESRPAKRSLGDYLFFIDLEGHQEEENVREALEEIQTQSAFFKVLGSYPRVKYPQANGNGL